MCKAAPPGRLASSFYILAKPFVVHPANNLGEGHGLSPETPPALAGGTEPGRCSMQPAMALTPQQLQAIVARDLAGATLKEVQELPELRYSLILAGGERVVLQLCATAAEVATVVEALRLLRGEVDLPIPQLRASDPVGTAIGQPYVVLDGLAGEPLEQALPRMIEDHLYTLGRQLGEVLCRVHRIACGRYGLLTGDDSGAADDERSYVLARLDDELARCSELNLLDRQLAARLRDGFEQAFKPPGRRAALVCGGVTPRTILVRQVQGGWRLSGLLGWERALGWSPAWDHVTFLDAAGGPRFFSLRVGYGNAYDDSTQRAYEQVREHALAPYRLLLVLQRMREAHAQGAVAERDRRRNVLVGLLRAFERASRIGG